MQKIQASAKAAAGMSLSAKYRILHTAPAFPHSSQAATPGHGGFYISPESPLSQAAFSAVALKISAVLS